MDFKFNVTGMTCAACSARVEKVTRAVEGVQKADVNLLGGTMTVVADGPEVTDKIIKAVTDAGYGASLPGEKREKAETPKPDTALKEMKRRIIGSGVFLIVLMYFTISSIHLSRVLSEIIINSVGNFCLM